MSRMQRALAMLAVLFVLCILRWLWFARITHDEGNILNTVRHFPQNHVMQMVYIGRWGSRWAVTTGPTISLPLGLLAFGFGVSVVVARLYVYLLCAGTFTLAGRVARLNARAQLVSAGIFLLWVTCMVWLPDRNGSSINLIANVFGEGVSFTFALLTNLLAVHRSPAVRRWAWPCAALSIGAKLTGAIAVFCPLLYLLWQAIRKRSVRELGLGGLLLAGGIALGWQAYLYFRLGPEEYWLDWRGLLFWIGRGGGYDADAQGGFAFTLGRKLEMLAESGVEPGVVVFLTMLAAIFLAWAWRSAQIERSSLLEPRIFRMLLASTTLFYAWFILLAGRGWMRHLWIGYALLGWLVSATAAKLLDRHRERWDVLAALTAPLVVISLFHGSLPALGPLGPTEIWQTQRELAVELRKRYPLARLMVDDWRMVPQIAFFMDRPLYNFREIQPTQGDLFLCDNEVGCTDDLYKYCEPQTTEARVAYCVYR